ncbi:MAG: hypothetical protein F4Z04_08695 [Acidobacteria bacterium]|nr:hypothetical protein [Acidobacteriota bacterium]
MGLPWLRVVLRSVEEADMKRSISILAVLAVVFAMGASSASAQDSWTGMWEVKVVNLTTQQVMTPFLLATHSHDSMIFTPGMPASEGLEAIAEGGDTMPLQMMLEGMSSVMSVETGMAMTPPGRSATLQISGSGMHRYLSLVSMLVPTNDAFVAATMELPTMPGAMMTYAHAWDAGTEANDESCEHIPGRDMWPECADAHTHPEHAHGEGFVTIHNGITGVGDFGPDRDWKNPVAMITVTRIQ